MSPKISSVVLEEEDVEDEDAVQEAAGEAEVAIDNVLPPRTTAAAAPAAFADVTSPSDRRTVVADAAAAGAGGRSSCSRIEDGTGVEAGRASCLSMSVMVESLLTSPDVKLIVSVQLAEESL